MKNNKYLILGYLIFWNVFIIAQNDKSRWSFQAMAGIGFSKNDVNKYNNTDELRPELSGIKSHFESIKFGYRINKNLRAYIGFNNCSFGYYIDGNQKYYEISNSDRYPKNLKHLDRMLLLEYGFKIDFSKSIYLNLGLYNGYNYKSVNNINAENSNINLYNNYMGMNVGFGYDWLKIHNFRIGNQVNFFHSIYGENSKYRQNIKGVFIGFCETMEL